VYQINLVDRSRDEIEHALHHAIDMTMHRIPEADWEDVENATDDSIYHTDDSQHSWYMEEENAVEKLHEEIKNNLRRCEELRMLSRESLSGILKMDAQFDSHVQRYADKTEEETTVLGFAISDTSLLISASYNLEQRELRDDSYRIARSCYARFLEQLRRDSDKLKSLPSVQSAKRNALDSLCDQIMRCKERIEVTMSRFPSLHNDGTTARLRTLLSRPALYKAWVRASLADLGHAQVHAPAGPEHAPGAAAQPAARHPGVAGAAAGAGHV
jgi:hypothetical protein